MILSSSILLNTKIFEYNQYAGHYYVKGITNNDYVYSAYYRGFWSRTQLGGIRWISFLEILDMIISPEVKMEILFHLDEILELERGDNGRRESYSG